MNLVNHEDLHKKMFEANSALSSAGQLLHNVVVALTAAGRHSDTRAELARTIALLEVARDTADTARNTASEARSELIRLTGCDGKCKGEL